MSKLNIIKIMLLSLAVAGAKVQSTSSFLGAMPCCTGRARADEPQWLPVAIQALSPISRQP